MLVLAGPLKNIDDRELFLGHPCGQGISPATHSDFTQAWTVPLSQWKAPLQGDVATIVLHSKDVTGQETSGTCFISFHDA